jgi:hypothetical protein
MKPINEMSLAECLGEVKLLNGVYGYNDPSLLADRIYELTRWIPVSERLPTEADADQHGYVIIREVENESPKRVYHALVKWKDIGKPDYFYTITDWKRIDT